MNLSGLAKMFWEVGLLKNRAASALGAGEFCAHSADKVIWKSQHFVP